MQTLDQVFNAARQRVLAGEQLTIEEQRNLLTALRANRFSAAETSTTAKKRVAGAKAAKIGLSDEELDSSLSDLGL
ncbi:MAG: hypothetical protein ACKOX6_00740 [Bdellovibrio sp.]